MHIYVLSDYQLIMISGLETIKFFTFLGYSLISYRFFIFILHFLGQ